MVQVLRQNEDGSISHVLYTTFMGMNYYLTKEANNKICDFSFEHVAEYYSGDDSEEVQSLKDDLSNILSGTIPLEKLKLNIAKSVGLVEDNEIISKHI